ncbi:S8 family serine peptidase [Deinococcus maricopensis]|uniref:Subtilisin n=1 Tax=Deinococcus maricopensis (strain DSM 21211 / LMG 22137 / NRRL B-23946 / LB-34) TaxID=709986 RepID=E8U7H8_DEIML|nr:S8 family serine peptidase [Deinococcus maricopensis]ADV67017.1 Subtilisin [Deinococcus maricopensis DSM 21211]
MNRTRSITLLGLALTLAACGQPTATTPQPTAPTASAPTSKVETTGRYFVGFKQGELSAQTLTNQRATIEALGGTIHQQWGDIAAAAISIPESKLDALRHAPGVEYVEAEPVRQALGFRSVTSDAPTKPTLAAQTLHAQTTYAASGEYTWGDSALRVPTLRTNNYTGAGVAVCVGDTGIDANHPEFQKKLKGFKNFVTGETYTDPYQTNDVSHHGTHVSGTIFAQYGAGTGATGTQSGMDPNGVGGVAPGVNLYMARVLGNDGSGSSSGIINGVNWCAAQLKSQGGTENKVVISLSLGGGRASQTEQRAYTNVYNKGALIIAATGNDGAAVSYPAAYTNVVGVGAIDANEAKADFSNFGAQVDLVGPGVHVLSTVPLGKGERASASASGVPAYASVSAAEFAAQGTVSNVAIARSTTANNELCGVGTTDATLSGKIALIARGTCSFEEKVNNAVASGAKAVMIYNNAAGELGMTLNTQKTVPVVGITQADGQATLAALPTTGTVSIGAADYEYFDGTSMATPHVSAAAAVVWAAKPTLTNTQLLSLLTSTAKDLGAAGKDDNFGYGLVDPYKAITGN